MTDRIWVLLLFGAGATLSAFQVFYIQAPWDFMFSDALNYITRAQALAGDGPMESMHTIFPLGISYLFAMVFVFFESGQALFAIALLQIGLLAFCPVLVFLTARHLSENKPLAVGAALMTAAYWPITAQASFYMAEPAFIFLILAGQYKMLKAFSSHSISAAVVAGLCIGLASIIKTQGVIILIAGLLLSPFLGTSIHRTPFFKSTMKILVAITLVSSTIVLLHGLHIGSIRQEGRFATPSNGGLNIYLGQSARVGLGTTDPTDGTFLIFFNNNAHFNKHLLPPRLLSHSLEEQHHFLKLTVQLWLDNPLRQIARTMQSAFELHSLAPQWPLRATPSLGRAEVIFKQAAVPFIYFPALIALLVAIRSRQYLLPVTYLWLTVLGITAVAGISMGQPRYLIPFLPNLMIAACFGWLSIINSLKAAHLAATASNSGK